MSAFGFDPEQIFARRRSRPRIVRPPGQLRRRIIIFGVIAAIVVLLIAEPSPSSQEDVRQAAGTCPARAIAITE